jgi:REP element-mobilizing transposase RayT
MPFKTVPRLKSFDYVGMHSYFLTICTSERRRLFTDERLVALVRLQLLRVATSEQFEVIAYCFMPDHLHALTNATRDDADFRRFARVFKQCSSFAWKRTIGGELWQRSYFEHVLREDEDLCGVARYIIENPVRAGLVEDALKYPFIGSATLQVRDLLYSVQIRG